MIRPADTALSLTPLPWQQDINSNTCLAGFCWNLEKQKQCKF